MVPQAYDRSMSGTDDRPRFLRNIVLVATPLLAILFVAEIFFRGQTVPNSSNPGLTSFDPLTLGFVSVLILGLLFYELNRHGERVARLLMAGITMSGTISFLILIQAWFTATNTAFATFFLLVPPVAYVGLYYSFRDCMGSLSTRKAGIFRALSATLLGAVLGAFLPAFFTIPFLILLSILDLLLIESGMLRRSVGLRAFDSLVSVTTLPLEGLDVGLGDLMAYSMLATMSILFAGLLVAYLTIVLILTGVLLSFLIARSRGIVPGLSLPLWFGLLPSIVKLLIP